MAKKAAVVKKQGPPPVAKRIADLRERLGLSQGEIARQLGVTRFTLSRWENGHNVPKGLQRRVLDLYLKDHDQA